MRAIQQCDELKLQVICAGTMVLERFGSPVRLVHQDGFPTDGEIYIELEGSTPSTMAKSVGFGLVEFASEFQRLKPEIVLIIGDRYEALAATVAAGYMNRCIIHIQGGEVSGSIDESARHAITKFAHYHVPSTQRSAEYLVRMGEEPDKILAVGCPGSDLAFSLEKMLDESVLNSTGTGANVNPREPYLLVVNHPITTEYGGEVRQTVELLDALDRLAQPTVLLWPNIDAGADHISKTIRAYRAETNPPWLRVLVNLMPEDYLRVLANAACAVGNSSSFVRDAGYFGTPVVLVGNRQSGREISEHVTRVPPVSAKIVAAVRAQFEHGQYAPSTLYGDGKVSSRVVSRLTTAKTYVQKRLSYVDELTELIAEAV